MKKNSFPFEEIADNSIKIKQIPIELCWESHGGSVRKKKLGGSRSSTFEPVKTGPTRQRPWFRIPPKVRIVLGILGLDQAMGHMALIQGTVSER